MNQPGRIKNPSADTIELTYLYLAEVETLVERLTDNGNSWFDTKCLAALLNLTQYLGLNQAKAILADVSEMELNNGVRSERIQKIRYAFKADKIKLFYELDTNWSSRSELENVA